MLMAESRDAITWRPATLQRSAHAAVPNAVLNDDDYAYDETSRPLLASLGEELARRLLR